jgi:hypothetical protein
MVSAGYVPMIVAYIPSLSGAGQASHVNLFAALGGAVFVASMLMIGALLIAEGREQTTLLFLASAALLVLLGVATQAWVMHDVATAWRDQKAIWHALFSAAPDFADGTHVVLILPDYEDRVGYTNWRRPPLLTNWEVRSALRVLYDNRSLSGDVMFPDIETSFEPTLTQRGIIAHDGAFTPYLASVFYRYDGRESSLERLSQLPAATVGGGSPVRLGRGRVLTRTAPAVDLRSLVE